MLSGDETNSRLPVLEKSMVSWISDSQMLDCTVVTSDGLATSSLGKLSTLRDFLAWTESLCNDRCANLLSTSRGWQFWRRSTPPRSRMMIKSRDSWVFWMQNPGGDPANWPKCPLTFPDSSSFRLTWLKPSITVCTSLAPLIWLVQILQCSSSRCFCHWAAFLCALLVEL